MTENTLRKQAVAAAQSYLGSKEGSAAHQEILATYNSHQPLPRGYAMTDKDAWCAAFVSAIAIKLGLTDIIPVECSCSQMIGVFKAIGRWQERDDHVPRPGDILFYDWHDSGEGDNTGGPEHVGIVDHVTDGVIFVIEGNFRDAVGTRRIRVDARYIRGYGLPDYGARSARKTVDDIAREVIAGQWGSGEARKDRLTAAGYDAARVQERVNELLGYTYVVRKGDTLWAIAEKKLGSGFRYTELMERNGLSSDMIYPGQTLRLPQK